MELSIREAARLLKVSAQTIHRLVHRENLPAQRSGDMYQFNRVELEEWARSRDDAVQSALPDKSSLRRAVRQGGIHRGLRAEDRDAALRVLAALPGSRIALAESELFGLLREREDVSPTTVGGGFALPHPRDASQTGGELEYVHICGFEEPVPFGALDGEPVHTAILLLSPSAEAHLQLLALTSHALRDATLSDLLRAQAEPEDVIERIDAVIERVEARQR